MNLKFEEGSSVIVIGDKNVAENFLKSQINDFKFEADLKDIFQKSFDSPTKFYFSEKNISPYHVADEYKRANYVLHFAEKQAELIKNRFGPTESFRLDQI